MKTVTITLTRKVTYQATIQIPNEDFEVIKDLDNDDVEMYDMKTVRTLENGQRVVSSNPQYTILENLDSEHLEIAREETIYNVTVEKC